MFRSRRRHGASIRVAREASRWRLLWGRRLRWLGGLAILVGIAAGLQAAAQKMLDPGVFPLRHVRVEGTLRNLNDMEVNQLVQGYLGRNFFSLDVAALQIAFAAHPWIEQVSVRRLWPDSLIVRFRERTAFARWGEEEMVDVNGERFRPTVIRQTGPWPELMGPDGRELTLIQVYEEASAMLEKVGLKIARLIQDERRAWWMRLDNGIEISLGRERFTQRLQRLVDVYPQTLARHGDQIATVDLRYVNGFAVDWIDSSGTKRADRLARQRRVGLNGKADGGGSSLGNMASRARHPQMSKASAG